MTNTEFIDLVRNMRITQKTFFRCKPGSNRRNWLEHSQLLERMVDKELDRRVLERIIKAEP